MSESATRKDIDEVIDIVKDFMGQVSQRFIQVNKRLDGLDQKYDHLITTIDGFVARIDRYETEGVPYREFLGHRLGGSAVVVEQE